MSQAAIYFTVACSNTLHRALGKSKGGWFTKGKLIMQLHRSLSSGENLRICTCKVHGLFAFSKVNPKVSLQKIKQKEHRNAHNNELQQHILYHQGMSTHIHWSTHCGVNLYCTLSELLVTPSQWENYEIHLRKQLDYGLNNIRFLTLDALKSNSSQNYIFYYGYK